MGRSPCCSKEGLNRGAWTALEDKILTSYIKAHGEGKWRNLPKRAGLKRCGKSCRLRWLNYLRPDIKRGNISHDEEELIIRLHKLLGNRWSLIAGRLPGRTDNEIKNYWNTTLGKKANGKSSSLQNPKSGLQKRQATDTKTSSDSLNSPPMQAIRTKATRCPKVLLSLPSPPSLEVMPENLDNLNYTTEYIPQLALTNNFTVTNDQEIHDEGYKNQDSSDYLNFGDGQIDYDCAKNSVVGCDQMLQIEEPMLKDWTNICLDDNNASFDLDSLASFLNSDEWA